MAASTPQGKAQQKQGGDCGEIGEIWKKPFAWTKLMIMQALTIAVVSKTISLQYGPLVGWFKMFQLLQRNSLWLLRSVIEALTMQLGTLSGFMDVAGWQLSVAAGACFRSIHSA